MATGVKAKPTRTKAKATADTSRVLYLYANLIFFGNRAYGVQAAARRYFDKDVSELDLRCARFHVRVDLRCNALTAVASDQQRWNRNPTPQRHAIHAFACSVNVTVELVFPRAVFDLLCAVRRNVPLNSRCRERIARPQPVT